ncbi:MAG: hypothetical protein IJB81_11650 [Clostridia bacterium]|nr:hypothetical protein [Clostridia bacterium]
MSPLTPKLLLSGFFGLLYGLLGFLMLMDLPGAGRWALIIGLSIFATTLLFQLLREALLNRRYEQAKKLLPCEPSARVIANLREGCKVCRVNVCVCREELILVNVEKKTPVLTRLRQEEILRTVYEQPVQLTLSLQSGRTLLLLSSYMEELTRQLRISGWQIIHVEK